MSHRSRRIVAASTLALFLGAVAPPAFAAEPTPLARTIEQLQPGTDLNFTSNVSNPAGDHQAIRVLVANAAARLHAASVVARIPADADQQAGKAEWLSGQREGIRFDVQAANAAFEILSGHRAAGLHVFGSRMLRLESNRINDLQSHADQTLGVK